LGVGHVHIEKTGHYKLSFNHFRQVLPSIMEFHKPIDSPLTVGSRGIYGGNIVTCETVQSGPAGRGWPWMAMAQLPGPAKVNDYLACLKICTADNVCHSAARHPRHRKSLEDGEDGEDGSRTSNLFQ
jgi:hypothetical protein